MIQHGFSVQRTGDPDLDKLQQRIKSALDTVVSQATGSQLSDKTKYVTVGAQDLQNEARAPDSVAVNSFVEAKGAYQHLTGTATLNFMVSEGWFDGARVEFLVVNGLTFNHHAATTSKTFRAFHLLSGAATAKAAGTVIVFRLDLALGFWVQVA